MCFLGKSHWDNPGGRYPVTKKLTDISIGHHNHSIRVRCERVDVRSERTVPHLHTLELRVKFTMIEK